MNAKPLTLMRRYVTRQRNLGSTKTNNELVREWARKGLQCADCSKHPWDEVGGEFYVSDRMWQSVVPSYKRDKIMCMPCFEKRLGRKLRKREILFQK